MTVGIIVWIVIAMIFYSVGEVLSKKFGTSPTLFNGFLAWLFYSVTTVGWLYVFKQYTSLSVLGTIWSICCLAIGLVLGICIFHEPLTTIKIIGLIFGFISVILLSL